MKQLLRRSSLALGAFFLAGLTAWAGDATPRPPTQGYTLTFEKEPKSTVPARQKSYVIKPIDLPAHMQNMGKPLPLPQAGQGTGGPVSFPPIQRTVMQQPAVGLRTPGEESQDHPIQLDPPGPEQLFGKLQSEPQLQEQIRQEAKERKPPERVEFPSDYKPLTLTAFQTRVFPPMSEVVEPYYVCHRRLLFEQINFERYGWDLAFITPAVSLATFWYDLALLPYHTWTDPCRKFECNAGLCLPGDPVPFIFYPPECSVPGTIAEMGTIVALFAIFPG